MTKIPYCDKTLPLVRGCSKVSPGCAHCYAERISHRFGDTTLPWIPAHALKNVTLHPELFMKPLHWKRPRTIFVCATGELFHECVPDGFIDRTFAMMRQAGQHRYLVLTKRAERMHRYFTGAVDGVVAEMRVQRMVPPSLPKHWYHATDWRWPLPNVWLGVTAENQHWADERIPLLLKTPAAHRWASIEPALGPVDLPMLRLGKKPRQLGEFDQYLDALKPSHTDGLGFERRLKSGLDWVVVGGESGPKHRRLDLRWVAEIADQCHDARVPYFGKQASGTKPNAPLRPPSIARRELPW